MVAPISPDVSWFAPMSSSAKLRRRRSLLPVRRSRPLLPLLLSFELVGEGVSG